MSKILIIEDNVDLVATLRLRLEATGYEVFSAPDGVHGLKEVGLIKPDLIILDVMMPYMNGYKVCETLKKEEAFKKIPIIILTARVQEYDKFIAQNVGADAYIPKPFDSHELMEIIKKLLAGVPVRKD